LRTRFNHLPGAGGPLREQELLLAGDVAANLQQQAAALSAALHVDVEALILFVEGDRVFAGAERMPVQ
jgi:hypothetical protein